MPAPTLGEGESLFVAPPEIESLTDGFRVVIGSHYELLGTVDAGVAFGVQFGPNDARNTSSTIPGQEGASRGCAEIVASLVAARSAPANVPLRIGRLCSSSTGPRNGEQRRCTTHETLRGAKLSKLTQALTYQGIRALKVTPTRPTTDVNIALIQDFLKAHSGHAPVPEKIWESIRHKDITSTVKSWLWKSAHGAHWLGSYCTHIPGFEDRAMCSHCGSTESLQHILFECPRLGQAIVWRLVTELWAKKQCSLLPAPSLGMVLGSALTSFEKETKSKPSGTNRLYRILITESAYLIWKLRNESVIQNGGTAPPAAAVHNRWVSLMNERLKIDAFMATTRSDQHKILVPPEVVLQTWGRTLLNEVSLPKDWLRDPRVLVGIKTVSSSTAGPPLKGVRPP
ncbi:hypothetical protein DFH07DRAFT_775991 [Mycena maculata]|uniref:Reverse transcriptase zinc-binding domain-containing protein n=1 Tax=Mycena maculata TaxID=230809 RepID=A0AAD7N5P5_9AGAR|nr:hypothetical protein DFH07DRAFT_775991 [Mycena maculata]